MNVLPFMKTDLVTIGESATMEEAIRTMLERQVGMLPVLSDDDHLLGVINLDQILDLFVPDFVSLVSDVDFITEYGALEFECLDLDAMKKTPVTGIMDRKPLTITEDCKLVRALSLLHSHHLYDLPVERDGKLVGLVSRVDIGRGLLTMCSAADNIPGDSAGRSNNEESA